MKKVKLFFGLIILIFTGLVIYQNRDFFLAKQALSISLGVDTWHWTAPGVENVAYWGSCLLIGLLFSGYLGVASKFKSKRTIKSLNKTIASHLEMISSLKIELEAFKNDPYHQEPEELEEQEQVQEQGQGQEQEQEDVKKEAKPENSENMEKA